MVLDAVAVVGVAQLVAILFGQATVDGRRLLHEPERAAFARSIWLMRVIQAFVNACGSGRSAPFKKIFITVFMGKTPFPIVYESVLNRIPNGKSQI